MKTFCYLRGEGEGAAVVAVVMARATSVLVVGGQAVGLGQYFGVELD